MKVQTLFLMGAIILSTSSFAEVSAITKAFGGNIQRTITGDLTGEHHINIDNRTHRNQRYTYTFSLCPQDKGCDIYTKSVVLVPGQNYRDDRISRVPVKYGRFGHYSLTATTSCEGGNYLYQQAVDVIKIY